MKKIDYAVIGPFDNSEGLEEELFRVGQLGYKFECLWGDTFILSKEMKENTDDT